VSFAKPLVVLRLAGFGTAQGDETATADATAGITGPGR
jgi:hypothetical protein